jgi:hypothetical protein
MYTTTNEDGTPVTVGIGSVGNVVTPTRPGPNILTLLKLMMESNIPSSRLLPTLVSCKWSPDLLVDTYAKYSSWITKQPPHWSREEQVEQAMREALRQKISEETGLQIPGTISPLAVVPFMMTADAVNMEQLETILANETSEEDVAKFDFSRKSKEDKESGATKTVASTTADWIQRVRTMLFNHNYKRLPDIVIQNTRVIEFGPKAGVRNPTLYPRVAFIVSANLSFIFDVFIDTHKLDVFAYGTQAPHTATIPPSLLESANNIGVLPVDEFAQYQRGLALALIQIRDIANKSRNEDKKSKTVADVTGK